MTSLRVDEDDYWLRSRNKTFNWDDDLPMEGLFKPNFANEISENSKKETEDVLYSSMVDSGGLSSSNSWSSDGTSSTVTSARYRQNSLAGRGDTVLRDYVQSYPATQVAKLESEIQHLKRNIRELPDIKDIINQIVNDEYYSLEGFRSRESKVALLDAALRSHDGNAILRTIIHLKHNTKPSIFQQELRMRPEAINHYLAYLQLNCRYEELADVLNMFGKSDEAAMVMYQMAISSSNVDTTIKLLKKCLRNHFIADPSLQREAVLVQEQVNLLEKQLPIEKADSKAEMEGKIEIFTKIPRKNPLPRQSVLDTLYYCCVYHFELSENNFASPLAVRRDHQLTNKQFTFVVLSALAELKEWKKMESFLLTRGFTKTLKLKSEFNLARVCELLSSKNAPFEVVSKYIAYLEDLNQRLELGKRFLCHEVVIDTLMKMKDREQLFRYKNKLPVQSRERLMAEEILKQNIKWKK